MMQTPFPILQRVGKESIVLSYLFIVLRSQKRAQTKLQCGLPIVVARAVPHVETVDRGPKVIHAVWMKQKALKDTNTCTGQIAIGARESVRQRHANQGGSQTEVRRFVCELRWMELTTCDVSASPGELLCQIHARKINDFVDSGLEVCVRCGGQKRQLCVKIQTKTKNMVTLNKRWPENLHEQWQESVMQAQVCRYLDHHDVARKSR